jgi:hypothetical protein
MPNLVSRRMKGRVGSGVGLATFALLLATTACESVLDPAISLILSQPTVQFRAVRGSAALQTQTIKVSNAGGGRLGPVTCPELPANWLACSVTQGNSVTFTANPTGLATSPAAVVVPLTAAGVTEPTSVTVELIIQEPVIALSPNTLAFTATEGSSSATPSVAVVQINNSGAGPLSSFGGLSCVPAQAGGRASCSVNQSTGELTVSVDPTGLAPGTHIYSLTVSSPNSSVQQNLQVSLRVIALPRIALSSRTVQFLAIRGGSSQTQTVTVTNSGEGSLGTVSCTPNPTSWLSCSVSPGTGGASTVTFTANPAGAAATPAPATVNITATGAANSPQTVTVTMALEQPILELSQNTVTFNATESSGGITITPPPQVIVVTARTASGTAVSPGTLSCTQVQAAQVFIQCVPGTNQVTLSVNPLNAAPGVYVSTFNIAGSNSNVTRPITVVVTVTPRPEIQLNPSTVTFVTTAGSTTLMTDRVVVTNIGGGTLGELSCPAQPASYVFCTVEGTELVITVDPTGFTQSPPPVVFDVTAANDPERPKALTVQLLISQTMALSASSASFTAGTGGAATVPAGAPTNPVSTVVQVSNTSGGTVTALGTFSCNFGGSNRVVCSINQSTGQVTITVNPSGLAPGTFQFPGSIAASSASNSPQPFTVNLTVTNP